MNNYIKEALHTRSNMYCETNHDVEHGIIGITTEAIELLSGIRYNVENFDKTNMLEELGDICWYLAITCHGLDLKWEDLYGFDMEFHDDHEASIDEIIIQAGELLDHIKRIHFYGIDLNPQHCIESLRIIYANINLLSELFDSTIEIVQSANIKKLRTRYPEKWTKETAIQRDLIDERNTLEQNLY